MRESGTGTCPLKVVVIVFDSLGGALPHAVAARWGSRGRWPTFLQSDHPITLKEKTLLYLCRTFANHFLYLRILELIGEYITDLVQFLFRTKA